MNTFTIRITNVVAILLVTIIDRNRPSNIFIRLQYVYAYNTIMIIYEYYNSIA